MEDKKPSGEGVKKEAVIIYRNNDLFERCIPVMEETLTSLGYETVRKQVFPAGTSEEEIETWYHAHKEGLDSSDVLADYTTKKSTGYELKPKINLDDLMNQATKEAITGDASFAADLQGEVYDNHGKKSGYLSALGAMYEKILGSIPEEKRKKLEVVILRGLFRGNYVFPSLIAHEPHCPREEKFEELIKETNEFSNMMKGWFERAGISNITVYSTGAEIPFATMRKLANGKAYIIFDRHTSTSESNLTQEGEEDMKEFWGKNSMYSGLIKESSALQTPIETFYSDIQKKIGIAADPQEMEELVKKRLEEKL